MIPDGKPEWTRQALCRALKKRLKSRCQQAYLFGSYARKEAHPQSDIDLIVIANSDRLPTERGRDFLDLVIDFSPLDLIVYTPQEWAAICLKPNLLWAYAKKDSLPLF